MRVELGNVEEKKNAWVSQIVFCWNEYFAELGKQIPENRKLLTLISSNIIQERMGKDWGFDSSTA